MKITNSTVLSESSGKSAKSVYVLDVGFFGSGNYGLPYIGAWFSDNSLRFFDTTSLKPIFEETLTSACFGVSYGSDVVCAGLKNGDVLLFDVRQPGGNCAVSANFRSQNATHPFSCLSLSSGEIMLAIGTELQCAKSHKLARIQKQVGNIELNDNSDSLDETEPDSQIIFMDLRKINSNFDENCILGSYSESHSDTITCLKFHPDTHDKLISASADGLLNSFNLKETTEDDALQQSLNANASVYKIGWVSHPSINISDNSLAYSVTDDNRLQVWDPVEGDELCSLALSNTDVENRHFLVDCFGSYNTVYVIASTERGRLKYAEWTMESHLKSLRKNDFKVVDGELGHSDFVRCLAFDQKSQLLITGGEDGRLYCSRVILNDSSETFAISASQNKQSKWKRRRHTPY